MTSALKVAAPVVWSLLEARGRHDQDS